MAHPVSRPRRNLYHHTGSPRFAGGPLSQRTRRDPPRPAPRWQIAWRHPHVLRRASLRLAGCGGTLSRCHGGDGVHPASRPWPGPRGRTAQRAGGATGPTGLRLCRAVERARGLLSALRLDTQRPGRSGFLGTRHHPALPPTPHPGWPVLEAIQQACSTQRVLRDAAAWRALPLPAPSSAVVSVTGPTPGYALVGQDDTTRYVYEVAGAPQSFPELWQRLQRGASRVWVNERLASDFQRWLVANTAVTWRPQTLAHWQIFSPRAQRAAWREWHIPWFDRI